MKIYKKILVSALFISSLCNAQTTPLEPFSEWAKARPNWSNEITETSYVASRCGALFSPVGIVTAETGRTPKDKEIGENIVVKATQLSLLGFELAKKTGWSPEKIMERHKSITEIYFKTIRSNRTTHNNMFNGFIKDDFEFCIEFDKKVREVFSAVR